MKKRFVFGGLVCLGMCLLSCADNIADDVYQKEDTASGEKNSSLAIELLNAGDRKDLLLGALGESLFNEQGLSREVTEGELLMSSALKGNAAVFEDMMSWYRTTLFFNVFAKDEHGKLSPLTHSGNELRYQVVAGKISKTIDLDAVKPDAIRKTQVNIQSDATYSGKTVYFTDERLNEKLEKILDEGKEVPEDLYLESGVLRDGALSFLIDSPASAGIYHFYLAAPEKGITYLSRQVKIDYESPSVTVSFEKEKKKVINISATYLEGESEPYKETPLDNKEVYLISSAKWPAVKEHVEKDKGNPEPGTYVSKATLNGGKASFGVFCTEGQQKYTVYIPKWNTGYYDSYETREVTVGASGTEYDVDIKALFTPPGSGGETGVAKTVEFTVKVDSYPAGWRGMGSIFIVPDPDNLEAVYNYAVSGYSPPDVPFAKSDDVSYSSLPYSMKMSVEINTSKEITVFLQCMKGFMEEMAPMVKRIKASEITGNTHEVTLEKIEHLN